MKDQITVKQIDACLPQTQCQQCHYASCYDYAKAIKTGEADINQCPPGGNITIQALSNLLQLKFKPLNPTHGQTEARKVAVIHEAECIGCTKCIQACPVSCIIGSNKLMHTIIDVDCTGCKLCIPVCPTDCIDLKNDNTEAQQEQSPWPGYSKRLVENSRQAIFEKNQRQYRKEQQKQKSKAEQKLDRDQIKMDIMDALARKQGK